MANLKLIKNGVKRVANKKRRTKRRRRNPATTVAAKKNPAKRRNVSSASVKSFAKRNGLKLVKANGARRAPVANKRHKRRRRNGAIMSRSNGLFGNSKETVVSVVSLLAGLGVTKVESALLSPLAGQALGMLGLQNFAKPIVEAGAAVTVNKWAAEAIKKGSGKYVMYGGLAMALMSLVEQFIPQTSAYNPFATGNNNPLVLNQPVVVDPRALAAAASANTGTMGRPLTGYRRGTGYRRVGQFSY